MKLPRDASVKLRAALSSSGEVILYVYQNYGNKIRNATTG